MSEQVAAATNRATGAADDVRASAYDIGTGQAIAELAWKNSVAVDELVRLVELLGLPDTVRPGPGGKARWGGRRELRAMAVQSVKVCDSVVMSLRHGGGRKCYVTVRVRFELPGGCCYGSLLRLHDGLKYDAQTKALSSRTDSMAASVAVLAYATGIRFCMSESGLLQCKQELEARLRSAHRDLQANGAKLFHNVACQPGNPLYATLCPLFS